MTDQPRAGEPFLTLDDEGFHKQRDDQPRTQPGAGAEQHWANLRENLMGYSDLALIVLRDAVEALEYSREDWVGEDNYKRGRDAYLELWAAIYDEGNRRDTIRNPHNGL